MDFIKVKNHQKASIKRGKKQEHLSRIYKGLRQIHKTNKPAEKKEQVSDKVSNIKSSGKYK